MKSIVQTNVERRVKEEAQKKTLIDSYGSIIGWMKVLADWILAPAGAIMDGLVLFGIFYLAVKNIPLSVALAAVAAVAIQFLYGKPAAVAASTAFSGRYQNDGEQKLMWAFWVVTFIALGGSLFLSFHSDKLVEAVGERIYIQQDDTEIQQRYDTKLQQLQQLQQQQQQALQDEIATLSNDKIMWKGQLTTRERSSRAAARLRQQLPELQQQQQQALQQLEQQRQQALQQLSNKNEATAAKFAIRVDEGGATLKGINIAFNLVRLAIILIFMYFTARAAEELQQAPTPVATNVGAHVPTPVATVSQHRQAATATPPIEPDRTVVKPFSTVLPEAVSTPIDQQAPTSVATNVGAVSATTSNTYNVTIVDGAPTLPPPPMMNTTKTAMTLQDVKRYIPTYHRRNTENARQIHRELLKMQAILEKETKSNE